MLAQAGPSTMLWRREREPGDRQGDEGDAAVEPFDDGPGQVRSALLVGDSRMVIG